MRGLGAEMGTAVATVHARHGVDVRCGVQVAGLATDAARVRAVTLAGAMAIVSGLVCILAGVMRLGCTKRANCHSPR